jgi:hypothetical protein
VSPSTDYGKSQLCILNIYICTYTDILSMEHPVHTCKNVLSQVKQTLGALVMVDARPTFRPVPDSVASRTFIGSLKKTFFVIAFFFNAFFLSNYEAVVHYCDL